MKKKYLSALLIASVLLSASACTVKEEKKSEVKRSEMVSESRLYIIAEGIVTGGHIDYKIYKNGAIVYSGEISYLASFEDFLEVEYQQFFSGIYRIRDKKSTSSLTYSKTGLTHREYLSDFSVDSIDDKANLSHISINAIEKIINCVQYPSDYFNNAGYNNTVEEEETECVAAPEFSIASAILNRVTGSMVLDLSKEYVHIKSLELNMTNPGFGEKYTVKFTDQKKI